MKIPKNFTKFRAAMRGYAKKPLAVEDIITMSSCFLANEAKGMKDPTSETVRFDRAIRAAVWAAVESFMRYEPKIPAKPAAKKAKKKGAKKR